ncbi:MAG TPA: hypothetical protein VI455_01645 [Terriglobia bacterium]
MHKSFLKIAATGLLVLGVALWGTQTRAQDAAQGGAQAGAPQGEHAGHGQHMSPDEQLQRMGQALSLTDDQKSQIKPILEDRQKQMEALHSDTSVPDDQKRTKMRSIMEDSNNKIRGVLNDEQKQKFDQMQQRMHERMHKPPAAGSNQ